MLDRSEHDLILATLIFFALLFFGAMWCARSAACEDLACPAGQRPELVRSMVGMDCACVAD